jgi:2-keto-4-pentenoate hydratase/2-oxohepta-3-ene-1,7-dioic acid hydratase in catechol pathway
MKLVTFIAKNGERRSGALIDGGRNIADLQALHLARFGKESAIRSSVLDFDGGNAMGPCLVTADEIPDPYALTMIAGVNGEEWARGNTGEMSWKFEDCIAHVSRSETLHPGEFFGSGTVGGGCGLETMRFLKSGRRRA